MGNLSNTKKLLIGLFLVVFLGGLLLLVRQLQERQDPRSRAAGEAVNFTITPSTQNVTLGSNATFDIGLQAQTNNTTGVDITMNFDPTKVQTATWQPAAHGFSNTLNNGVVNMTAGTIRFTVVNVDPTQMPSTIQLGRVVLTTKALGTSNLSISKSQVTAAGIDTALPVNPITPATYTVNPVPTNTPLPTATPIPPTPTRTPTPTPTPVPPTVTLNTNPQVTSIPHNGTVGLAWSSTNATSCTATGDWTGTKTVSGTQTVGPFTGPRTLTFTLTCTGAGGSRAATTTVQVTAPTPTPIPPTPTTAPTATTAPLVGDYNRDGKVDLLDFNLWKDEYLEVVPSRQADGNNDTVIDLVDFAIWRNVYIKATTPSPTSPLSTATPTPTATQATLPSQVLNLTNWKVTLPTGSSGSPTEIKQPALATYSIDPWFIVAPGQNGVRFRAPVNGVTTSGSSYPRSELREMTSNGASNASWSSGTGTHTMFLDQAITAVPTTKKHVVAGQIHDANDDVIVIRLEYPKLFIDINGNDGPTLDSNYTLGKRFTVKFEVQNNQTKIYYNGSTTPSHTLNQTYSGAYFKTGAYTQSNCSTEGTSTLCNNNNYGEVIVYQAVVTHQ
jgi:hypothetical protein